MERFTIIDNGRAAHVDATVDAGAVLITPQAVESALGWQLKPEGFCRDGICLPLPADSAVVRDDLIDLVRLAGLLGRPIALDAREGAAYIGVAAAERARNLASLQASDFMLPDIHGRTHTLSQQHGNKVLLVAWASW